MSVLTEGDVDLDEYRELVIPGDYRVEQINGHLYSFFPIGAPLFAVPFVFAADRLSAHLFSIDNLAGYLSIHRPYDDPVVQDIERFAASFIAALTAMLVYLIAQHYLNAKQAVFIAMIFSFCTPAWSTASRALWQHGPSMLMLTTALYMFLLARNRPYLIQFSAIPLALSYIVRPTNSVSILLLTILVLLQHRRYFLRYCLWASIVTFPFVLHNFSVYGNFLSPYYWPQRIARSPHFYEALVGNLFSPSRGLFIFSPVLLFSIYGGILKVKALNWEWLDFSLVGTMVLHWVTISSFPHWYGGHSVGPRFFTDIIPYFMVFLVPVIAELKIPRGFADLSIVLGMLLTTIVSAFIHYRCANSWGPVMWNSLPVDIDRQASRIWDWSDPQFLRGLGSPRISVTPGYLYAISQYGEKESHVFLVLRNMSEKPLYWKAIVPSNLSLPSAAGTLQSFSTHIVSVDILTEGYDVGTHSLGGIYIDSVGTSGNSTGNILVVPVSLRVIEGKRKIYLPLVVGGDTEGINSLEWEGLFIPPVDLLVDGCAQEINPARIRAVYGRGWYDRESMGEFGWRWAMSPAEIYIYSPSSQTIRLMSKPVSLYAPGRDFSDSQGVLKVVTNDHSASHVAIQDDQEFIVTLSLRKEWNVVRFELEAGNFRPVDMGVGNGDSRLLSFALAPINIMTR